VERDVEMAEVYRIEDVLCIIGDVKNGMGYGV